MIEYYINELLTEGIVHIPVWADTAEGQEAGHFPVTRSAVNISSAIGDQACCGNLLVADFTSPVLMRAQSATNTVLAAGAGPSNTVEGEGLQLCPDPYSLFKTCEAVRISRAIKNLIVSCGYP